MAEQDLELLFVEDPSNVVRLTCYDSWSLYVHQGGVCSKTLTLSGGAGKARIGLELENYYFSLKAFLELRQALPEATMVNAVGAGELVTRATPARVTELRNWKCD